VTHSILLTRSEHHSLRFLVEYIQRLAIGRFIDTGMLSFEDKIELIIKACEETGQLKQALKQKYGASYLCDFEPQQISNLVEMIGTLTQEEVAEFVTPELIEVLGTRESRLQFIQKLSIEPPEAPPARLD
jgi:hypothetical protein